MTAPPETPPRRFRLPRRWRWVIRASLWGLTLAVTAPTLLWLRLQAGPWESRKLAGLLARRMPAGSIGHAELFSDGLIRPIAVRLTDVRWSPASGTSVRIGSLEVTPAPLALMTGRFRPLDLLVDDVAIAITPAGTAGGPATPSAGTPRLPAAPTIPVFCPTRDSGLVGRLESLDLRRVRVTWTPAAGPEITASLEAFLLTRDAAGASGRGVVAVASGGESHAIGLLVEAGPDAATVLTARLRALDARRLAQLLPRAAGIDAHVDGSLSARFDIAGGLLDLTLDLSSPGGAIDLHPFADGSLRFSTATVAAAWRPAHHELSIRAAGLTLPSGASLGLEDVTWTDSELAPSASGRLILRDWSLDEVGQLLGPRALARNRALLDRFESAGLLRSLVLEATATFSRPDNTLHLESLSGKAAGHGDAHRGPTTLSGDFFHATDGDLLAANLEFAGVPSSSLLLGLEAWTGGLMADAPVTGHLSFQAADGTLVEASAQVDLGHGTIVAPDLFEHDLPLAGGNLSARLDPLTRRIVVDAATIDFDQPGIQVRGSVALQPPHLFSASVTLLDLDVARYGDFWPRNLRQMTKHAVQRFVAAGRLPRIDIDLGTTAGPDGSPRFSLQGRGTFHSTRIEPTLGLPAFTDLSGTVGFTHEWIAFDVTGGGWNGNRVRNGTVVFTDLAGHKPMLDLALDVDGGFDRFAPLLGLIPPRLGRALTPAVKAAGGSGHLDLVLSIPLLMNVELADCGIEGRLDFRGGDLDFPAWRVRLSRTEGSLAVDAREHQLRLHGNVSHAFLDAQSPRAEGPVAFSATLDAPGPETQTLHVTADLSEAALAFPGIGWPKAPGETGELDVTFDFAGWSLLQARITSLIAGPLAATGTARFGPGPSFAGIEVAARRPPGTDATLALELRPEGWHLSARGEALDIAPPTTPPPASTPIPAPANGAAATQATPSTGLPKLAPPLAPLDFEVALQRLQIRTDQPLNGVRASGSYAGDAWRFLHIDAGWRNGSPLRLRLDPLGLVHRLEIESGDAGELLTLAGLPRRIDGGRLSAEGTLEQAPSGDRLRAGIRIEDFSLRDAPLAARILSVATLTGIADVLTGRGIGFRRLQTELAYDRGVLTFERSRAYGTELGVVLNTGRFDLAGGTFDLSGSLWPGYALNAAFRLPLLRDILTGPEGQGLVGFAFRGSGSLADPRIEASPLPRVGVFDAVGSLLGIYRPEDTPSQPQPPTPTASTPSPAG